MSAWGPTSKLDERYFLNDSGVGGVGVTATAAELNALDNTAGTGVVSKAVVLDSSGNFIMPATGLFSLSRAALAATGSGASTAAVIATQVVAVTASDGTKAVALPAAAVTTGPILVINTVTTAALPVYPVNGGNDNINAGSEDAAFTLGPGKAAWFIPTSATQWYVEDAAAIATTTSEANILDGVLATADEINRAADVSTRLVSATASTLAVTVADHDGKTVAFNRAAGVDTTLPAATGTGARFRFVVATAFTGTCTIKVNGTPGTDTMVGLVLALDGEGAPANAWTVGGTDDTITFDGAATPNMTQGGFAGDLYEIEDIASGVWQVNGFVKQTGTEATPMSASVP